MGLVKKKLGSTSLPDREAHNSRLFVDLCENIHIHFRELRVVFSLDEYFEFVDILNRSTEDIRSYLAQNPDYEEGAFPSTVMVGGGKTRQRKLLQNSPAPNESTYFPHDFEIELQDESVVDEIHVHWRDYRFALPRSHFKEIAQTFYTASKKLEEYEAEYQYIRKPHRDRKMEDFKKEREKYDDYETAIMGETKFPVSQIKTRFDNTKNNFSPSQKAIKILEALYRNNEKVPPVILSTEKNGEHHLIDGNHRLFVAKKANLQEINCIITDLTFAESNFFRKAESLLKEFDRQTDYRYIFPAD